MGNFYANYTLYAVTPERVAKTLSGRNCYITPSCSNSVVVFDEQTDEQDQTVIAELAESLSRELECAVLAILNHDDDILWYRLYRNGDLEDEYDSSPGYFDSDAEPSDPTGGDAAKLCLAFDSSAVDEVERILRRSSFDDEGYVFAIYRHSNLVAALGISPYAVGASFASIDQGYFPEGVAHSEITRISAQ